MREKKRPFVSDHDVDVALDAYNAQWFGSGIHRDAIRAALESFRDAGSVRCHDEHTLRHPACGRYGAGQQGLCSYCGHQATCHRDAVVPGEEPGFTDFHYDYTHDALGRSHR